MPKSYSVGLVGESNYQQAIKGLREGERVLLVPEPDNPHDPRAIACRDGNGATIGYIPRDHWLTAAILDEGKGARAVVKTIHGGDGGRPSLGVVLTVELAEKGEPVESTPSGASGKFKGFTPDDKARQNRQATIGCLGIVGVILLLAMCTGGPETDAPRPAVTRVSDVAVAQCREPLKTGEESGVIKGRPSPNRINVEETLWAALPADVKDRTLQAVACDLWQTAMPPAGEYVVAYGYRSGQRLQMLTEVGMSRK